MTIFVDQDVVRFDISVDGEQLESCSRRLVQITVPVDETHLVNSFNRQNAFSDVESGDILRESVVLDEHGHQITSRQKLHNEVEILRVLERVE